MLIYIVVSFYNNLERYSNVIPLSIQERVKRARDLRPTQTGTEWQGILIFTNGHSTVLLQKYDINCYALK